MKGLSERQRQLLSSIRRATDQGTLLHKSGDVDVHGLVARGTTVRSLERRGLVEFGGFCVEVDGDGFSVTGNDDAPWYRITTKGREALGEEAKEDSLKWYPVPLEGVWDPSGGETKATNDG